MTELSGRGLIETPSGYPFDETVSRLTNALGAAGVTVFAIVDHGGEAAKAGLTMPPTRVIIAGNPKAGTPLMIAAPTIAIDLPLKILVRQNAEGRVSVASHAPAYLAERHGLPAPLIKNIAGFGALIAKALA